MRRLAWGGLTLVCFLLGLFIGRLNGPPNRGFRDLRQFGGREQSRVTDPTGRFDALVLAETYGPAGGGGVNWYVCIVRKGQPAISAKEAIMMSTSARNETVLWREPHLLEIHYDRAEILDFTNLWSTNVLKTKWFSGEEPYWIEIRLVPSSPTCSIMTPDGSFQ
jgi:hypothetical protein